MPPGKPTSFRLSPRCLEMLTDLKEWLGLQTTGVIEVAVRKLHQTEERSRAEKKPRKSREGG